MGLSTSKELARSELLAPFRAILAVQGFSLLIGASSQVAVPLPFTPVPMSTQTLAVLLTGAFLGPERGLAAVLLFLAEGTLGLPFFAGGGSGIGHLLGPTGGFLLGFLPAAFLAGRLASAGRGVSLPRAAAAMLAATGSVYAVGLPWLSVFVEGRVLALGLLPFLPGDLLKAGAAAVAARMASRR